MMLTICERVTFPANAAGRSRSSSDKERKTGPNANVESAARHWCAGLPFHDVIQPFGGLMAREREEARPPLVLARPPGRQVGVHAARALRIEARVVVGDVGVVDVEPVE